MNDDNSVGVVGSDSVDEVVTVVPGSQLPRPMSDTENRRGKVTHVLLVTGVAVDSDVGLTRVRSDKDESDIRTSGSGNSTIDIKVIKPPVDGRTILAGASLDSFEGLK